MNALLRGGEPGECRVAARTLAESREKAAILSGVMRDALSEALGAD